MCSKSNCSKSHETNVETQVMVSRILEKKVTNKPRVGFEKGTELCTCICLLKAYSDTRHWGNMNLCLCVYVCVHVAMRYFAILPILCNSQLYFSHYQVTLHLQTNITGEPFQWIYPELIGAFYLQMKCIISLCPFQLVVGWYCKLISADNNGKQSACRNVLNVCCSVSRYILYKLQKHK